MWKIRELKSKARQTVKKNYWTAMIVCFLIALLTGEFGTSIVGLLQEEDSMDPNYIINQEDIVLEESVDEEKLEEAREKSSIYTEKIKQLNDTQTKIFRAIEANLNSITKSQKYLFKIWDAINSFNINQAGLGIGFSLAAIIAILFTIVIANPFIVAGKRYFLKARKEENAKMKNMEKVFKKGSWMNVSIIMFLRSFYNILWYLTIVGGIIKSYEYRMIPYILAENPKVARKDVFKLSKEMMRGNKWKMFLLDVSFIGWSLLSIFTYGLLNILYVNPYKEATIAELYMILRKNAMKEKYQYYEELNDKTLEENDNEEIVVI